ncbi:MAG TPA: 2-dehydropantoate 2-reductase [Candidatus Tumulicola sp.]
MRVAVVGAGAIGGFLAGALARAGVPVAIVARGAHLAAIRHDGLAIESDLGTFRVRVDASDDLRELGEVDVLALTFKAHQWPGLLPQLAQFGGGAATVVTFQNGLPFWYVREPPLRSVDPQGTIGRLFSDDVVLGGVVHVSGHVAAPGVIVQSGGLRFVLGDPLGRQTARLDAVAAALRAGGLDAQTDANVRATLWLKLVNNVGLNPVSALRRMTIRPMLANPAARAQVRALMAEAMHVGQAMGVIEDVDLDARIDYAARLDDVKTSMLQDRERGRELELEPILGSVMELAKRYAVAVPHVSETYAALRRTSPGGSADG